MLHPNLSIPALPKIVRTKRTTTETEVTETLYGAAAVAAASRQQTEDPNAMDICDPYDADLDPPASFADREAIAAFTRYLNTRVFIDDTMAGIRARIAARKAIDDAQEMADAAAASTSRQGAAVTASAAPPECVLGSNPVSAANANALGAQDVAGRAPSVTAAFRALFSRPTNRPARHNAFDHMDNVAGPAAASTSRQAANTQVAMAGPSAPPAYSLTAPAAANHTVNAPQTLNPPAANDHRGSSVDLPNVRVVDNVYYIDITDDEGDVDGEATDRDA